MQRLFTERLILRPFSDSDVEAFIALHQDAEVMRHFPALLSEAESTKLLERLKLHHREHGFGVWAVEIPGVAPFAGCVGLSKTSFEASFTPSVELAWRLARGFWDRGYATEAAAACVKYAFETLRLPEVVAFTALPNTRSMRVMERLGMSYAGQFEHPKLPEGHALRRHVLYRVSAPG